MRWPPPRSRRKAPRRFLLLVEEAPARDTQRSRVRRYLLTSLASAQRLEGIPARVREGAPGLDMSSHA